MKFIKLLLPLFFLACGPYPEEFNFAEYYQDESYIIAGKPVLLPGDLIDIKFSLPKNIYFRVLKNSQPLSAWQLFDINNIKPLRLRTVEFATKDGDEPKAETLKWSLETYYTNYFKEQVISRSQWDASPPKKDMDCDENMCKFAVHHTAGEAISSEQIIKNIQRDHMNKWSDIGYHFLIGIDGKCFEGRELKFSGAHVLGHNKKNIGISFLGCFDTRKPNKVETTDEMIDKMGELIGVLAAHYGINITRETVKGHQEFAKAKTLCPGDLVMRRMDEIVLKAILTKVAILDLLG